MHLSKKIMHLWSGNNLSIGLLVKKKLSIEPTACTGQQALVQDQVNSVHLLALIIYVGIYEISG